MSTGFRVELVPLTDIVVVTTEVVLLDWTELLTAQVKQWGANLGDLVLSAFNVSDPAGPTAVVTFETTQLLPFPDLTRRYIYDSVTPGSGASQELSHNTRKYWRITAHSAEPDYLPVSMRVIVSGTAYR